jgi:hypothetical protein
VTRTKPQPVHTPNHDQGTQITFQSKPDYVRFRWLGHRNGYTEMTVQAVELADTPPDCSTVFVVENEITYLAFPPPEGPSSSSAVATPCRD